MDLLALAQLADSVFLPSTKLPIKKRRKVRRAHEHERLFR